MKNIFLFLAFVTVVSSCKKQNDLGLLGSYSGTFKRVTASNPVRTANVSLTLENQNYAGSSDQQTFPAICAGSWMKNKNTIKFSNTCLWLANFDWTLILDGEFEYSREDDRLILRKNYSPGNYDEYDLKRR